MNLPDYSAKSQFTAAKPQKLAMFLLIKSSDSQII